MQPAFLRSSRSPLRAGARVALRVGLAGLLSVAAVSTSTAQDRASDHPAHHAVHHAAHEPVHGAHPVARPAAHPATHAHAGPAHRPAHHAPVAVPVAKTAPPPPPAAPPASVVPPAPLKGSSTGLPLPRFASLRADAVNLRGGPGTRYPIQWVYKRRDLPVRIEREFDVWRLVEDSDGVKGWVHQATLVGTRTFVIPGAAQAGAPAAATAAASPSEAGETRNLGSSSAPTVAGRLDAATGVIPAGAVALRASPQPDGNLVAVLMPGIVGRIRSCSPGSGWCKVSVRDYSGWLPRSAFWGLLPDETILPP